VVFDCDGVLIDITSSWVWIHQHFGVDNEVSWRQYDRGEIDGLEFMRRDIALWHGKRPDVTAEDIREILDELPLMKGAEETFTELKRAGVRTAIVSGGLDLLVDKVGRMLGADHMYSNRLCTHPDGRLNGEGELIVEPRDKSPQVREVQMKLRVGREATAAVGDTAGDATMFKTASLGIAFNFCDDIISSSAQVRITEKDLTKVLDHLL
jgi:phosphoserine phosphatase